MIASALKKVSAVRISPSVARSCSLPIVNRLSVIFYPEGLPSKTNEKIQ